MEFVTLAVLIGLAFIPASMAKKKGYSYAGFWVFGFLLFLPAIIVAACLSDKSVSQNVYNAPPPPYVATPAPPPVYRPFVLFGISGMYAGRSITLSRGEVVFGRNQAVCNLLFPDDTPGISRRHCTLSCDGQAVWLSDDNSSNGTFLGNGERLQPGLKVQMKPGQRFCLASTQTMFELRQ